MYNCEQYHKIKFWYSELITFHRRIISLKNGKLIYVFAILVFLSCFFLYAKRSHSQHEIQNTEKFQAKFPILTKMIASVHRKTSITCFDKMNEYKILQRGRFLVLYNYIRAIRWFKCHESVTYTTISDLRFLDNIEILSERWKGPISIALYTPGTDFEYALESIKYLYKCSSYLIPVYVTFHIYFEDTHRPKYIPKPAHVFDNMNVSCELPPWQILADTQLYRIQKNLFFPINIGRNIARNAATTHYILASDIELYPSANIISQFLDMIESGNASLRTRTPAVFVLPPFEIKENVQPPILKRELVEMLQNGNATEFHKTVCVSCHNIPQIEDWIKAEIKNELHIFHTIKKQGMWEPFYIGTNSEPYFDERLSWEGRFNKLTQAYAMCLLDYDYHILDNAFLVHKPGIKKFQDNNSKRNTAAIKNYLRIRNKIEKELHQLYGINKNCSKKPWFR